jgi:positive phototaxis protein PixI
MNTELEINPSDLVKSFLSIELTDNTKALLPIDQLVEILSIEWEKFIPIPETDNSVIGVFNWRQNITWLIDLPIFLGLSSIKSQMNNRLKLDIVVVKCDHNRFGLSVLKTGQISRSSTSEDDSILVVDAKTIYDVISGSKK